METRADRATDSWYDFGNYITFGSFDLGENVSIELQYNAENMFNSPSDFANWLTIGGVDTIQGAINPEENFSKEHWLASFGLATVVVGGAKIPASKATKPTSVAKANPVTNSPKTSSVPMVTKPLKLNTLTNVREWFRVNVPEIGLVQDSMGGYHFVVKKGDGGSSGGSGVGVKGAGEVSKVISDIPHVKEAKDIIAERTKGLDLKEHPTTTKQMSSKKMKEFKDKIDNRTITKQEYADYIWNKKFAKRRDKGVKEFWYQEQQRLLNNELLTRDWSQEQLKDILAGKTPKYDGKPIAGHHSYSASNYPHLADRGEIIYPATFNEHLKGWHGGNWRNSIPGEPIIPIKDF